MHPYAMETGRTKLYNLTPSTVIFLKTSNFSRLSLKDFFSIPKIISAYKFSEFFNNVCGKFLQLKYSVEKTGSYHLTSSIRKRQLLNRICKFICVNLNKTTLLIICNNAFDKLKICFFYLQFVTQLLFITYCISHHTNKLKHLIYTKVDDDNDVKVGCRHFTRQSVLHSNETKSVKPSSTTCCTTDTLTQKCYDKAPNKLWRANFCIYFTWVIIIVFLSIFNTRTIEAIEQGQESASLPNQYNLINLLQSLSSIGKQLNSEILTESELRTWNYLLEKILKTQINLLKDNQRLDYTPSMTTASGVNSISREFSKYDKNIRKPSKAELTAKTPSYMFKLHERHMNDWHSFRRFEDNHLLHPDYEKYLSENQFSADNINQNEKEKKQTEHHHRHHLGMITAIRHHKYIESHEHENSEEDIVPLHRSKRNVESFGMDLSSDHIVKKHKLVFRLADMPSNEHLIAASIRIRYEAKLYSINYTIPTASNFECSNVTDNSKISSASFYWPLSIWLHSDLNNASDIDVQTAAIFEPDDLQCRTQSTKNSSLINLPNGWFHIPLNQPVLHLIERTNQQIHGSKQIVIQIHSVARKSSSSYTSLYNNDSYVNTEQHDYLKVNNKSQSNRNLISSTNWLHSAPHLFTYHRDPKLAEYLKRKQRSVNYPNSQYTFHTDGVSNMNAKTATKNIKDKKIARRYKRLKRLLSESLKQQRHIEEQRKSVQQDAQTFTKLRSRRRAHYQRRHNRSSKDRYYYADMDSVNGMIDAQGINEDASPNRQITPNPYDDNRENNGPQQYQYDITRSYHSNILQTSNHHYLDTTCQRRELIINFDAVGWAGWVIAPRPIMRVTV
ncbi:unnamed protein product [Heterobilharzia americana]|nr:unnamed protein product [Heterobilharzia americana]